MTPPEIRPGTDDGRNRDFTPDTTRLEPPPQDLSTGQESMPILSELTTYHWLGMEEGK